MNGMGCKEDPRRALELYQHAAMKGDSEAQFNLGTIILQSFFTLLSIFILHFVLVFFLLPIFEFQFRNIETQIRNILDLKFNNSNSESFLIQSTNLNVGVLYLKGTGCTQDAKKAVDWFQRSAAQGNEGAVRALRMYFILS